MLKRIFCILFVLIMAFALCTTVFAYGNNEVMPCYEYTKSHSASLYIANGKAICESSVIGYSDTVDKVVIEMTLEKKVLWWWSSQEEWNGTFNNYRGILSKECAVKSGTYRISSVGYVYDGNNKETINFYSNEIKN